MTVYVLRVQSKHRPAASMVVGVFKSQESAKSMSETYEARSWRPVITRHEVKD